MKLKTRIASIAVGLAVAAGAIVTASPATAATVGGGVSTQGMNTCKLVYPNQPACWFRPGDLACAPVWKCTRY